MKYIKYFEGLKNVPNINKEIEDIFLTLTDEGFSFRPFINIHGSIIEGSYILDKGKMKFSMDEVKDTLKFLQDFLSGYNISMYIDVGYLEWVDHLKYTNSPGASFHKKTLYDMDMLPHMKSISYINIYIKLNNRL